MTPYNSAYLNLPESTSQTASRSVQPFLHCSQQSPILSYTLQWATGHHPLLPLEITHSHREYGLHLIHGSLGSPKSTTLFSGFAGLTIVTDRQTDHATPSVTTGRIYVRGNAMWPKIVLICERRTNYSCG